MASTGMVEDTADWTAAEERGGLGETFELEVTFRLPYEGDAYDMREAILELVVARGGRDPYTRLIAVGEMGPEEKARRSGDVPG